MRKHFGRGLAVLVLLSLPRPALAQWVIAGYFGAATTGNTSLTLSQPASNTVLRLDPVDYEGQSFRPPPYYGYRVAYFLRSPGWFGLEGELIHMKVFAQVPTGTLIERFSLSHGQNMLLANAVVRHALGECGDYHNARLVALARVGAGPTLPHVESTIGGIADERYERGALAVQVAGGVELLVWKHLHALAEYKFTRCRQSVDAAAGAHIETLLRSHHFAFGLSWQF